MKKYILIIGGVLLVFNTLIGLLFSSYSSFNIIFVDINIILSIALLVVLAGLKIESTYKITLAIIFIFTGIVRIIAASSSVESIQNNPVVIGILIIFAIEILVTLIFHSIKRIEK
jgi:hypothetical protein